MAPWKSLAPWVLLLVQESHLLHINSDYKNLGYKIYTTIPKDHMQTTLDAIIGEKQSAAIEKYYNIAIQQYYTHFLQFDMQLMFHIS